MQNEIDAPAPWQLQGNAYICLVKNSVKISDTFIGDKLRDRLQTSSSPIMVFVDYTQSPVGPYYELLFIPGRFKLKNGTQCQSISRIFVSSLNSVTNGIKNWGIPKELADFNVNYHEQRLLHVTVSREGQDFAELQFNSWPVVFPFTTWLLPKAWRTFLQINDGKKYIFQPSAFGLVRPASLIKAQINSSVFPAIKVEDVCATIRVTNFKLCFPEPVISLF